MKIDNFLFNYENKNVTIYSKIISIFCLVNIIILIPDIYELFSENGLINSDINNNNIYPYNPLLSWLSLPLESIGFNSRVSLLIPITSYLLSIIFILLNYQKLLFSIIAWFLHIMLTNSSYYFSYGADYFITLSLFINIFFSFPKELKTSKILYSFAFRLIQLQMYFVYFFAGFGKILGTDWFDGNAIWYVLNSFSPKTISYTSNYSYLFIIISWLTVIIELCFPVLICNKYTRKLTFIAIILLHVGIIIFMKFYTFGCIMILLNIIAWGKYFKINDQLLNLRKYGFFRIT